jgi:hypothetical protein
MALLQRAGRGHCVSAIIYEQEGHTVCTVRSRTRCNNVISKYELLIKTLQTAHCKLQTAKLLTANCSLQTAH